MNDGHHNAQKLLLIIRTHLGVNGFKMLHSECLKQPGHTALLLLLDPQSLEGRKEQLVEFGHQAEAGALVEKVELLVVLVKTLSLLLLILLGRMRLGKRYLFFF